MATNTDLRTPNLALRRARQAMRLSQAEFAAAVRAAGPALGTPNQCTKRLVQKWENGEHSVCRPDYLRVLQAVTGLGTAELGFRGLVEDPRPVADEGAARLTEESISRLRHALEHPSTVDSSTADLVEAATARLFDLEHHCPAKLLGATVDRHLTTVSALLTAARHQSVRRRLSLAAGHSSALAGWLAFDRRETAPANRYWDTAIGIAESSADGPLLACGLTYLSYSSARRSDAATAWQLAHTATRHCFADLRASAWAHARAAHYAALLGERGEAMYALEQSLDIGNSLPNPRPGDGGTPWTRFFDQPAVLASAAHTAAHLEDPRAMELAMAAVHSLGPNQVKSRAVVLAEATAVAAMTREFDLCLDWGIAASALSQSLGVSIAIDLLRSLIPQLLTYSEVKSVRELLPQMPDAPTLPIGES